MSEYDLSKIDSLINDASMDEEYFVKNLKRMIDKGGNNMTTGMKMLGELKGLGKKANNSSKEINFLARFGAAHLLNTVQKNRMIGDGEVEEAEIIKELYGSNFESTEDIH